LIFDQHRKEFSGVENRTLARARELAAEARCPRKSLHKGRLNLAH
jgi:hypothetical protein